MKASYNDIRDKIKEEPFWYDENGTLRYAEFHPDLSPNIYSTEVVLLKIACQHCHKRFDVEMHWSMMDIIFHNKSKESFEIRIKNWLKKNKKNRLPPLHYGDPPIHCCIGDTENCYDLRILEFWKQYNHKWRRLKRYEIKLEKEYE